MPPVRKSHQLQIAIQPATLAINFPAEKVMLRSQQTMATQATQPILKTIVNEAKPARYSRKSK